MTMMIGNQDKDIRLRANEALAKYNIKQIDLAKETGIHHSTLSLWLQGKVKGTTIKIDEQIEKWLNNLNNLKPKTTKTWSRLHLLKAKREKPNFDQVTDNNGFGNLIPININVELEGKKFKEIFFWDMHEPYLQPEQFVKLIVDENHLPSTFESEILNQLTKQINQYQPYDYFEGEILKLIKLDIRLGEKLIVDQFEWDINNPHNNPEDFAKSYCQDLSLGTEFLLPIAHSVREQILDYRKSLLTDRRFVYQMIHNKCQYNTQNNSEHPNLTGNFIRELAIDQTDWQPTLKTISLVEIQKYEQKEERKSRYAQRKK